MIETPDGREALDRFKECRSRVDILVTNVITPDMDETAVTNAANLSFFMVNFSYALLQPFRHQNPDYSILDLKSYYRGCRYAQEIIKKLP